jgi:putative chitinase
MLTLQMMKTMWPRGNGKVPGLLEGIAEAAIPVFEKYGLTSKRVVAHAMAQFSHECGAGTGLTENINYTAKRACQVWPSRFKTEASCYSKAGSFAGDRDFCAKLINHVYGGRNGNRPGTEDGSLFIGRGLSHVTGRGNYEALGKKTGLDLVNDPRLVNDPAHALECGVASFVLCKCFDPAQADDVTAVTRRLNGGLTGLDERKRWLARWKAVLGPDAPRIANT